MAALKNVAYMGASTLVRLVFGLLPAAIMARLLGSQKLKPLISVLYGHAQMVQVVAKRNGACRRPSVRKCFEASLQAMTAEIV